MRSRSPRRWAQALAVTLPLGLEPAGDGGLPPRVALPPEIVADGDALGGIGVVFHAARPSEVCGAVALRDGPAAPQLAAFQWRATAGPSRSTPLVAEKLPAAESPDGFTIWYACSPSPAPAAGAAIAALLVEPNAAAARRRLEVAAGPSDVWRWRAVAPVEARAQLDAPAPAPRPSRDAVTRPAGPGRPAD